MTSSLVVLWIYIVLLVVGGLMGLKAGSKISLYISLAFAALLALCALNIIRGRYTVDIILLVLLFVFGARFARKRTFMPMGLMTVLTIVTLAARHLIQ